MDAYELTHVGWKTSVCGNSLKLDGIVRGLMNVLDFCNHRLTCSMNPEIAVIALK